LIKFSLLLCVKRLFFKQFYAFRELVRSVTRNILSGKYDFLREGVELLLAEKTPYDWVIRGGGLYILRRSQIRTTSQYDKRLNNLKMVKNWQFQRGNCSKYYEEKNRCIEPGLRYASHSPLGGMKKA